MKFVKIEHPDAPAHLQGCTGRVVGNIGGRAKISLTDGRTTECDPAWLRPVGLSVK